MLSFDWKQKGGPSKDGGEIWVVWAPHNGAAVPGQACVLQQGRGRREWSDGGDNPPDAGYKRIFYSTGAEQKGRGDKEHGRGEEKQNVFS